VLGMTYGQSHLDEGDPHIAVRALGSRGLIVLLVVVGLVLRVAQYVVNRSIWHDEALLALNLIDRPLSEFARPLQFGQAAPVGFLFAEGIASRLFGYSEYVLRFFPLVCGLLSLPIFAWLARRVLSPLAAPFALLLFVVADALIYYASEVKPYETDVAAAVILLAGATLLGDGAERHSRATTIVVAVFGITLIAMSFAATFIVAALAATFAARVAFEGRRERFRSRESLVLLWWVLTSIGIAVFGATRGRGIREAFEQDSGRFLGVAGSSSPLHAVNAMGTNIAQSIGFSQDPPFNQIMKLALFCAVVGAMVLLRRNPARFAMLVLPLIFLFVASAAHAYPISERTELFLVPVVVLLIAEGIVQVLRWVPRRAQAVTALLLVIVIAGAPVALAAKRLVQPRTHEEIKPVLRFVRDHWREGDALYVHWGAQYALLYYEKCGCLRLSRPHSGRALWPLGAVPGNSREFGQAAVSRSPDVIVGRYFGKDRQRYLADLNRIRHRQRVWFLYTHLIGRREESLVEKALLGRLGSFGERIDGIDRAGAHAYLYRMRPSG
jgi:hypothetical protein